MSALRVVQPGMLSLLQDAGRFGRHRIGLGTGGPLDSTAMTLANRLLGNADGATALEASFGGLELEALGDTTVAVAGGDSPLTINGEPRQPWRAYRLRQGDRLALGFAQRFSRSYLAVAGGFQVDPMFGSTATVVREGIGGLDGGKLDAGAELPIAAAPAPPLKILTQPLYYSDRVELRVVPGYQWKAFPGFERRRFFSGEYEVTNRSDRMGFRLQGPAIDCELEGILSEGICHGAIQVPADGQPIVLLQDRQTIGGYPKLGSALSIDTERLAQLMPGAKVRFSEISAFEAHNILHLHRAQLDALPLVEVDD